jgi:hypothetical protein
MEMLRRIQGFSDKEQAMSRWSMLMLLGAVTITAGCSKKGTDEPNLSAERARLVLSEEPDSAVGVREIRAQLIKTEATEVSSDGEPTPAPASSSTAEVTLIGRIGGVEDPWDKGRAAFMITDIDLEENAGEGHDDDAHDAHDHDAHDHDAHDHKGHNHAPGEHCPFCDRAKNDTEKLAIVQFVSDDGEVLPHDARKLFGLTRNQTVVVRGKAILDEAGVLTVSADKIFVK